MNKEKGLTDKQMIELLKRSYAAVDGLWFMMLEKETDFETALKVDAAVWDVLPKIQVRKIVELTGISGTTPADFLPVLKIKFGLEEYKYQIKENTESRLEIQVDECPWVNLLQKSDRMHIAERLGDEICTRDLKGWAQAFNPRLDIEWAWRRCTEQPGCRFSFFVKEG